MNTKFKLKKGDEVIVLAGKDKGKTGKIVKMLPKQMKAIVSEINKVKKNQKPDNNQPGGIIEKEIIIDTKDRNINQNFNINNFNFQIAGKTGTTNNNQDAWFIGYNSELTVGVFVGYDVPKSLGRFETGSKVAAPIFNDFMKKIYSNKNPRPFIIPKKIKFMNIDLFTGEPTNDKYITEAFKSGFSFDSIEKGDNQNKNLEFRGFY